MRNGEEADGQMDPDFVLCRCWCQTGSGLGEAFLHVSTRGCCWPSLEMLTPGPSLWSEKKLLYKLIKLMLQGLLPALTPSTFAPNLAFIMDYVSTRELSE